MTKKITVITVITLAAILAAPAMAYRDVRSGHGMGPGAVADIAEIPGLDLSVEQMKKISILREAHLEDIKSLQKQLHGKGGRLRELWLEKTPDRDRILALQREVHDLRGRLLAKLAVYRREVHQILTPEQQGKLQTFDVQRRRMGAFGIERRRSHGWWEGEQPPGGPRREKQPGPRRKAGSEDAQGSGGTGRPAAY